MLYFIWSQVIESATYCHPLSLTSCILEQIKTTAYLSWFGYYYQFCVNFKWNKNCVYFDYVLRWLKEVDFFKVKKILFVLVSNRVDVVGWTLLQQGREKGLKNSDFLRVTTTHTWWRKVCAREGDVCVRERVCVLLCSRFEPKFMGSHRSWVAWTGCLRVKHNLTKCPVGSPCQLQQLQVLQRGDHHYPFKTAIAIKSLITLEKFLHLLFFVGQLIKYRKKS